MAKEPSTRTIAARFAASVATFGLFIWLTVKFSPGDGGRGTPAHDIAAGIGAGLGVWIGLTISALLERLGLTFPDSPRGEIMRVLTWLAATLVALALERFPSWTGVSPLGPLQPYGMIAVLICLMCLLFSLMAVGKSWRARQKGPFKARRVQFGVGMRLLSAAMGAAFLGLTGLLTSGLVEEWREDPVTALKVTAALVFVAGMGIFMLVGPFVIRITFDKLRVCGRWDILSLREHCHLWRDLTQIEDDRGKLVLRFLDGGKVVAMPMFSGYRDLEEHARAVLAARGDSADPEQDA